MNRRTWRWIFLAACGELLLLPFALAPVAGRELPDLTWLPAAPQWPAPQGRVVEVATVDALASAVRDAQPGDTISIAEGRYFLPDLLELRTDRVTLRGKSGRREAVILDGSRMRGGELLAITACTDAVVADLTVQNVRWNGIKLNADRGCSRVTIHHCILRNIWQRAVKSPFVPPAERERLAPRDCRIQHCLFYNDRAKEPADDAADTYGGDYVGGIDAMCCRNWSIADNVFFQIQGHTRQGRGAVFLWQDSRDCLVERNVVIDCDVGISLGNSWLGKERVHCTNCIVRNNFVAGAPESGILADYTRDCRIVHNTIWDPDSRKGRLIRIVHDNDDLQVAGNLLLGSPLRQESTSRMTVKGNVVLTDERALVDPRTGNLHLRRPLDGVTDAAGQTDTVKTDFDNRPRGAKPDIGADEWEAP
ncbi:MAG: right-handed parallel beta-helix repeat-containing protein [Pirellulaceae bacterium]